MWVGTPLGLIMRFVFYSSVFLILYGSLYPFDFSLQALSGSSIERFLYDWSLLSSRGDQLGNIALFIPYGFLGMLSLGRRSNLVPPILALTIFGLVLAIWVQVLQLMLPSRDAAMGDVAWNFAGIAVGILMAYPRRIREAVLHQTVGRPQFMVIVSVGCWLVVELSPFVPSIDFQAFKDSIKPLWQASSFSILAFLRATVAWIVIGHIASRALPPRTAWPLFASLMCGTLLAKIIIVDNAVTLADAAAVIVAFFGAHGLQKLGSRQTTILVSLISGYLVVAGLSPFNFHGAQNFHWVPFAGSLSGSMLLNLKALAAKIFFISALVYLSSGYGFRLKHIVMALAASLFALEIAQIWVGGHTPEITDPILAVLIGAAFVAFRQYDVAPVTTDNVKDALGEQSTGPAPATNHRQVTHHAPGALDRAWLYPSGRNAVLIICATVALTAAIYTILGLPKIPYNVRELFGGQDSWWRLGFFSLAVFSFGMGGAIAGHRVARSSFPWVALPLYSILACCITYLLLAACVTSESLSDIAGSSNTYFFVMKRDMWGDTGVWLYTLVGSQSLIADVERIIRFTALMGPVFMWLAIFSAVYFRVTGARFVRPAARIRIMLSSFTLYSLSGALWLVAFSLIAFRYSSTDNLNELIQGNGVYLYFLLLVLLLNVIAVVHASVLPKLSNIIGAVLIIVACLPVGWLLFTSGLSAPVEKYGLTFRGADFLLGPDRRELLAENVLMIRWCAVQLSTIATLAFGMRVLLNRRAAAKKQPRSR